MSEPERQRRAVWRPSLALRLGSIAYGSRASTHRIDVKIGPQLLDRLVLLVAYPFRRHRQLGCDIGNIVPVAQEPQDALLPIAEHALGGLFDRATLVVALARVLLSAVRNQ